MKKSNLINEILSSLILFFQYFIQYIQLTYKNILVFYKISRTKTLLILLISIFVFFLFLFVSFQFNNKANTLSSTNSTITTSSNFAQGGVQEEADAVKGFLNNFDSVINLLKPVLDNFVGNTPDITGNDSSDGRVHFQDGTSIVGILDFYHITFKISIALLSILIVCTGINFVIDPDNINIKSSLTHILVAALLLVGGLTIMSVSIQFINEINKAFTNNNTITGYILDYTKNVKANLPNDHSLSQDIKDILSFGTANIAGFFAALPILIPFVLIIIMLFFICFQFITRFISLYFLAVIQPLTAIFTVTSKTKVININFWKVWITLLITQPAFVLGYAITQNILSDVLSTGATFTGLIMFLAFLLFLSSIGHLVGKVFGDVWTSTQITLQSSKYTNKFTSYVNSFYKPVQSIKRNLFNIGHDHFSNTFLPSKVMNSNSHIGLPSLSPHRKLKDK